MSTMILENMILPFSFLMVPPLDLPVVDTETLKCKGRLKITMDNTPIEILCVRWSHEPDIIAGTPRLISDTSNVSEASGRATAQLRGIYLQRGIPWPE